MNRFKGNLDRNHGTKLIGFAFNGRKYEVRTSDHSIKRFKDHGLDVDGAVGTIVALGKERLNYYAVAGIDVAIIDKVQKQTVIITFESEDDYTQIRIATIIPREHVYVKAGTKVFCLRNYKGGF